MPGKVRQERATASEVRTGSDVVDSARGRKLP